MLDPNNDRQTDFSNMFKEGRMGRGLVRGKGPLARNTSDGTTVIGSRSERSSIVHKLGVAACLVQMVH